MVGGKKGRKEGGRRERWALRPGLTGWKPLEDKMGVLRLTEAGRKDPVTGLISPTGATPNPIPSSLCSFDFPADFFQRKMASSEVCCEKWVAGEGRGLGREEVRGWLAWGPPRSALTHALGAWQMLVKRVILLCSLQSPAVAETPVVGGGGW